jgi:hypothetical protein
MVRSWGSRKQTIFEMWMSCATQEEIAEAINIGQKTVDDQIKVLADLEGFPNPLKVLANFQDEDFKPPLYNGWTCPSGGACSPLSASSIAYAQASRQYMIASQSSSLVSLSMCSTAASLPWR